MVNRCVGGAVTSLHVAEQNLCVGLERSPQLYGTGRPAMGRAWSHVSVDNRRGLDQFVVYVGHIQQIGLGHDIYSKLVELKRTLSVSLFIPLVCRPGGPFLGARARLMFVFARVGRETARNCERITVVFGTELSRWFSERFAHSWVFWFIRRFFGGVIFVSHGRRRNISPSSVSFKVAFCVTAIS